jgi:GxxExxY protein
MKPSADYADFTDGKYMILKDLTETDPRTYAIIGAAMEVHKQLSCGFLESVYQESLAIELTNRNIPFAREVRLPVYYKGQLLGTSYCADFICFDSIIVELKALARMGGTEES